MMRKRLIAVTSALALAMSLSLGAWAYPSADTFVSGYDDDDYVLLYTTVDSEDPEDVCGELAEVEDEEFTYTLGEEETVSPGDGEDEEGEDESRDVTTWDATLDEVENEDCVLVGVDTVGPEGQVNHGTVVSAFVHSLGLLDLDGPKGCLIAAVAQTDWGKDDQQVDLETDDPAVSADEGHIDSINLSALDISHCGPPQWLSDPESDDDPRPEGVGEGKPDWAGPPDETGKPDWADGDDTDDGVVETDDDSDSGRPDWAGEPGGPNNGG